MNIGYVVFFIFSAFLGVSASAAFLDNAVGCQVSVQQLIQQDPCPVDGNWASWSDWQECSATCGPGLTRRTRTCSNPPPSALGKDCAGDANDYMLCLNNPCPLNGFWSEWSSWNCYIFGNYRIRTRDCYGPMFGGVDCPNNFRNSSSNTQYKPDSTCK